MAVAAASGIRLAIGGAEGRVDARCRRHAPEFKTSMLQSLEKGPPTEVDYVNGAVVRWGERCGVATPVNQALVACVKGIEAALAGGAPNP